MNLLSSFTTTIAKDRLIPPSGRLLLAVSGGMDSVVLCELCHLAGYDFAIAHCNFGLRGAESDRDEAFVKALGPRYGKPVLVKQFATAPYAEAHGLSIQEAARALRYAWFFELLEAPGSPHYDCILTAHHADDNAETMLMNLVRGAGLHGLTGIPMRSREGRLVRPLLPFRREALAVFAKEAGLPWVEDSSNASVKYTRNLFRHEVIPAISKAYPQAVDNLNAAARRFQSVEAVYQEGIAAIKKKLYKQKGADVHIPVLPFLGCDNPAVWYELIKPFGFTEKQVDEVVKLCHGESGSYIEAPSGGWRLIHHRKWLIAAPPAQQQAGMIVVPGHERRVQFSHGALLLESRDAASFTIPSNAAQACLDARHISFPLLLRPWKAGDYFYPLGMKKKKKLARFFIDRKLSKTDKENAWVLEMNKKIVWVVGQRIDERFKITPSTKEVLKITWEPVSS